MGFIDKVKTSIKTGADMAATRAQSEYEKMQARRDLAQAYETLGAKSFELAERGEISHGELMPLVEQARNAKKRLDSVGSEKAAEAPAEAAPEELPRAETEAETG